MTILDPEQLAEILEGGEGRQVEFKEGLAPDGRVARTMCAFANTRGGILLIGISDRGEIRGVSRPGAAADRLRELAAEAVEPPVDVRVEVLRAGRRSIVCCSVPLSPGRPHAVRRGSTGWSPEVLVRSGSSNRAAGGATLDAILAEPRRRDAADGLEGRILRGIAGSSGTTIDAFARAHAVGKQKARQAFETLERAGLLIAHGLGGRRVYELP